ncbi:hypothetical protein GGE06_003996 [Streptomyces sp. SFB5A]|uniref:Uncharacterized protein n=1 Tax=Streptomyces nymphaeiformis TaxID=2663842 RepID=A0A7W7U145_9ACTN|nr:hypothetical protein [Streptomyces nymphaeiformis]
MAGNKRGSACVRVRGSASTTRFGRTSDHAPLTEAHVPLMKTQVSLTETRVLLTYTQNVRFRFEPYVNLWREGCPEG